MSVRRLLITGPPRCGKTTTIQRLATELGHHCTGFITREISKDGIRTGFVAKSLSGGVESILAHTGLTSAYRVGKYGVDIVSFERLLLDEFNNLNGKLVIIDEIGKMELYSAKFRRLISELWATEHLVIATILKRPHPFCDVLKSDQRTLVIDLSQGVQQTINERIRNIASQMAVSLVR
jgi:nucleoside-triphosphatase